MVMKQWVKLPTGWINEGGLQQFLWKKEIGANNVAALMSLMVLGHHANEAGIVTLTYDELCRATHLSRTKVAAGLNVLEGANIITRKGLERSHYAITEYASKPWGKIPMKGLYVHGGVAAFGEFHLRQRTELDALKLYFLTVARRDINTNIANMSYETISKYSGIDRGGIKSAASFLAALGLIHVEHVPSKRSEYGMSNGYRLTHLEPYAHMGTKGRGMDAIDHA